MYAAEVKSLESALAVRNRLLGAFEAAEGESDPALRAAWLTFVVVGAGPTGVEMAGQIGELARDTLRRDFRAIDPRTARILLVEAADRVLTTFPPSLSAKAERSLERLGVTVLTGRTVVGIDDEKVTIERRRRRVRSDLQPHRHLGGRGHRLEPRVQAGRADRRGARPGRARDRRPGPDAPRSPGGVRARRHGPRARRRTARRSPCPESRRSRCSKAGTRRRSSRARLRGKQTPPFRYRDKGNLATIGRAAAVADIKGLRLSGFVAWVTWLVVHLWFLVGFQNRLLVFIRWTSSFLTHGRGARLIAGPPLNGDRPPSD